MTHLEIIGLCAEALGWTVQEWAMSERAGGPTYRTYKRGVSPEIETMRDYDPLHDDALAMALVKKFRLLIDPGDEWFVHVPGGGVSVYNADLNFAICECVARMQKEKQ